MSKTIEPTVKKSTIADAHRRQFAGEDWQKVAVDLCDGIEGATEETFNQLSTSPDPSCACGFCATVEWQD